ncbi:MAG TPA: fibrobacter succinogenes major paralogous domain-containing protein [Bacteroidales bacterium]|nr:fibrobacter succinogenes major paralogous domain-containing protein [Bacteroidales bacterium]HPI31404.1 fibrobacter succinogenes major paralogous domain-containing protein [Bacteroidales bacterium]HQN17230.1 fibrobacter succinogenes major paralogous domain-containing protein [Bacteroidales bacterium]HQP16795.1 fibrobacter succinogenes major paralogous domain-containing protein [Bacteroidales bacterium]
MKSLHIFIFLGLFSAATYAQTVTLPPYYGVQSSTFKCGISTVKDYEGNVYNTVKIGNQCWLKENLRSTKYNDGATIPNVTDGTTWANLTTPAYCWYDNNYATYGSVYGALYNWYTVDTEKLCPIGWHVPSIDEWEQLTDYLGGDSVAGGKLKETGNTHWISPNTGATNESGFTALPGGYRYSNSGIFLYLGEVCAFWSTFYFNDGSWWFTYSFHMTNTHEYTIDIYFHERTVGQSVRCVKD